MTWIKGQSGNPSGLPKGTAEIAQLCRKVTPAVVERLKNIALHSKNERTAIEAGKVLLERGHGKPIQPVDTNASVEDLISADERAIIEDALATLAKRTSGAEAGDSTKH